MSSPRALLAFALSTATSALPLSAAEPIAATDGTTRLESLTVSATRSATPVRETASVVTVIDAETIETRSVQDIADLVRYEPGVSVSRDGARFGLGGFTIRGLGGDRVLIEVDGVPVSDQFDIGAFSNAGRDFVDPEMLKRVEILRGAASALYGSDAIGGVVSFTTKDPGDLLDASESSHWVTKFGMNSDDASRVLSLIGAFGDAQDGGLIAWTGRAGQEQDTQGGLATTDATRTRANPQDGAADNLLAKWVMARGDHTLRLTYDGHRSDVDTEVFSSRMAIGASTVTDLDGDDEKRRDRLSLAWDSGVGTLRLYAQDSETLQRTTELRTTPVAGTPTAFRRERLFTFQQDLLGLSYDRRHEFTTGDTRHRLVWGLEAERTETRQQRDGSSTNLVTDVTTPVVLPDVFPVRDFPPSTTTELGLFVHDEVRFAGGLILVPGLRVDRFRLEPARNDPIFSADNPGVTPVGVTRSAVSPKLGLVQPLSGPWTAFGQYAEGFRAPPYDDVNIGFTNLAFGYTAIANPNLEPEQSRTLELGLRRATARSAFELVVFHNAYDQFIESLVNLGVDPNTGLLTFQSQNIDEATIRGVELRAERHLEMVDGLRLRAALAFAEGEDETSGQPLNSVDPHKAVVGLDYAAPSQRWGLEFVTTLVAARDDADQTASQFETPGYALIDLMGWVRLGERARLTAGLFNLTDRHYWQWGAVAGRPADDPVIDRYSSPGLNASLALRVDF